MKEITADSACECFTLQYELNMEYHNRSCLQAVLVPSNCGLVFYILIFGVFAGTQGARPNDIESGLDW